MCAIRLCLIFKINFSLLLKLKCHSIYTLAHILLLHVSSEDTVIPICDFFSHCGLFPHTWH